jgi:HPr kinase/phosphorylase
MDIRVSAQQLYDVFHRRLELSWLIPPDNESRSITPLPQEGETRSLVGHLNFIHPHRIQVLGGSELSYLERLGKNSRDDALSQLFSDNTAMVILAAGRKASPRMQKLAQTTHIPLVSSPLTSNRLITEIGYYLRNLLAESEVVHGVFMDVLGIGVLLTGESAIGKSELALELITRGHRLIADDAPVFVPMSPGSLVGHCPAVLQNFIEVRGLGVLNIRAMFGDVAVKQSMELHLIVHLAPVELERLQQIDRLMGTRRKRQILDVEVDEVELPVAPGRNLAVLVEAAARNQILYTNGYDSAQDFIKHQQELMRDETV